MLVPGAPLELVVEERGPYSRSSSFVTAVNTQSPLLDSSSTSTSFLTAADTQTPLLDSPSLSTSFLTAANTQSPMIDCPSISSIPLSNDQHGELSRAASAPGSGSIKLWNFVRSSEMVLEDRTEGGQTEGQRVGEVNVGLGGQRGADSMDLEKQTRWWAGGPGTVFLTLRVQDPLWSTSGRGGPTPMIVSFPVLFPFYLALRASIPFVDPKGYNRSWLLVSMLLAPSTMCMYLSAVSWQVYLAAACIGAGLCLGVWLATRGSEKHVLPALSCGKESLYDFGPPFFSALGFVVGMMWIDIFATEAVGIISLCASVMRVRPSFMGLTLMAWGNSLGDLAGNAALAKKGFSGMALTACFASPLFNMLISFACGACSYFTRPASQDVVPAGRVQEG
eukprot:gene28389-31525_t